MPPCAQAVAPSSRLRLASTTTGPRSRQVQRHGEAGQAGTDDDHGALLGAAAAVRSCALSCDARTASRATRCHVAVRCRGLSSASIVTNPTALRGCHLHSSSHATASPRRRGTAHGQADSRNVPVGRIDPLPARPRRNGRRPVKTHARRRSSCATESEYLAAEQRDIGRRVGDQHARAVRLVRPGRSDAAAVRAPAPGVHRDPRHRHRSRRASMLAGIAAASSARCRSSSIRRQGYGMHAGDARVRRAADRRRPARCASTPPRPMPTRTRATRSRACCWPTAGSAW